MKMALFRLAEVDTEQFTPRSYQIELLDVAKKENIIIPLGTGTGKTYIAVLLIRELSADIQAPFENGGKRSFFLVDKVPLVGQQADQIRKHTVLKVGEHHGWRNVDIWNKDRWRKELTDHQVMVMTAQIFFDLLNHGFFTLEQANLIVFDECHHATKNHPYRLIMKHYFDTQPDKRPRILGLTASIVNERCNPAQLESVMQSLEVAMCSKIHTSSDLTNLAKFGARPNITLIKCKDTNENEEFLVKCRKILNDGLTFCKTADYNPDFDLDPTKPLIEAFTKALAVANQLGLWCLWKICRLFMGKHLKKLEQLALTPQQRLFLRMGTATMKKIEILLEPLMRDAKTYEQCKERGFLSNRLIKLVEILGKESERFKQQQLSTTNENQIAGISTNQKATTTSMTSSTEPTNQNSTITAAADHVTPTATNRKAHHHHSPANEFSCIIFVEQRYIAFVMRLFIKDVKRWMKEKFGFLKPDYVVGYSGYKLPAQDELALHRRQEEVLKKFRQAQLNLLCATSVLEEGVDVRQCNLVIRYDRPQDFRSYVQSKGRARKKNSFFYILCENKDVNKMVHQLNQFQKIEEILLKHCSSREDPDPSLYDADTVDKIIAPYYVDVANKPDIVGRPRVSMSTSIALINRYCARLPSDIFTKLVPRCTFDIVDNGSGNFLYTAKLLLPINSPVKREIVGKPMSSKKLAQMAVALKVCEILHKKEELDDHLLPVGKESAAKVLEFLLDDDPDDEIDQNLMDIYSHKARPGSSRRKQYYFKKIADALKDSKPEPDVDCYLHVIEIKLVVPANQIANYTKSSVTAKNRKIFDFSDCPRYFGVLFNKPLPFLPGFPLYTRQGEVLCKVHTLPKKVTLSAGQLVLVKGFHQYIFSDILRLNKMSMTYDPDQSNSTVYIVPLLKTDNDFEFDYQFICDITTTVADLPRKPDEDDRKNFEFVREKYVDTVVMPWYRNSEMPHFYYVAEISRNFKPSSPFPDNTYASFNDYFQQKYDLTIYNQEQNLLDVDYTSNRLNLLINPRSSSKRGAHHILRTTLIMPQSIGGVIGAAYNQKQILVPELVDVHPIPGSMWHMMVCLPSIMYRLNSLLLADELRLRILKEGFNQNDVDVPSSDFWEPLEYGRQKSSDASCQPDASGQQNCKYSVAESEDYEKVHTKALTATTATISDTIMTNSDQNHASGSAGVKHKVTNFTLDTMLTDATYLNHYLNANNSNSGHSNRSRRTTDQRSSAAATAAASSNNGNNMDTGDPFEIGVWDPNDDQVKSTLQKVNSSSDQNQSINNWMNGEMMTSSSDRGGGGPNNRRGGDNNNNNNDENNSGDEWDDEEDIYFSTEFSRAIMRIERGTGRAVNGEVSYADLFKPSPNIVPTGWDTVDADSEDTVGDGGPSASAGVVPDLLTGPDLNENNTSAAGGHLPPASKGGLQILSSGGNDNLLNTGALLEDIVHAEWSSTGINDSPTSAVNATERERRLPNGDGGGGGRVGEEEERRLISNELEQSRPQILAHLESQSRDYDDVDRLKPEDTLDLIDFSDDSSSFLSIDDKNQQQQPPLIDFFSTDSSHTVPIGRNMNGFDQSEESSNVMDVDGGDVNLINFDDEITFDYNQPKKMKLDDLIDFSGEPIRFTPPIVDSPPYLSPNDSSTVSASNSTTSINSVCLMDSDHHPNLLAAAMTSSPKKIDKTNNLSDQNQNHLIVDIFSTNRTNQQQQQLSIDFEADLRHVIKYGPSPCMILSALTLTNASDGINLERLETVGDSFLKYAVTMFLFSTYPKMHEGKLSFLRSKQVSNFNLYKLGKRKGLGELVCATKFEPNDTWLPPGYVPVDKIEATNGPNEEDDRLVENVINSDSQVVPQDVNLSGGNAAESSSSNPVQDQKTTTSSMIVDLPKPPGSTWVNESNAVVPYNLLTQHSVPDKSIADSVEALIGVYLLTYGPKGALQFMKWLGLRVLPENQEYFQRPPSPLLHYIADPHAQMRELWVKFSFSEFEQIINYKFRDKAYVVQAFTHASYIYNRITDCYQRLEFLGDAVLDYLITRHLYEDKRQHTPGVLTDLRSALVNNTIFASLAVKWKLHKFFMAICPPLNPIITKFVAMQDQRQDEANFDELYLINEEDCDDEEDIEVPKSLGDVFESIAGAIFLDSGCSLSAVWNVYYRLMKDQIEKCCANPPKSPIRELLELEPEKVKFAKLEHIVTAGKVRVTVDVQEKGRFTGMGRNYRIAKCTAAKRALKYIKNLDAASKQAGASKKAA